jgi:hypothetical protein
LLIAHQLREYLQTANDLTITAQHRRTQCQVTCQLAAHSPLKYGAQAVVVSFPQIIQVVEQVDM